MRYTQEKYEEYLLSRNMYYTRYLLSGLVYEHEVRIHRDRMRSTYYPGVCTKPGTYYQGWFMYMRYTQGQNEEYLLSRSMYYTRYLPSKSHCM